MKQILSILIVCLLYSCQQEEDFQPAKGNLALTVHRSEVTTDILSRAVADDLWVEIWQEGALYTEGERVFRFAPGTFPRALTLPAGNYQVKAFSTSYERTEGWTNEQLGEGIYYAEVSLTIDEGQVNRIDLAVPMLNVGVNFTLPHELAPFLYSYQFIVTQISAEGVSPRRVSLREGQTVYLDAKAFSYELVVKNTDGEEQSLEKVQNEVVGGTVYTVAYTLGVEANLTSMLRH